MILQCERCLNNFEAEIFLGYCEACKSAFAANREGVHAKQRPMPGVFADGKFSDERLCPKSVVNPLTEESVCGLCGSDELDAGYGIGGGYGLGCYNFCTECGTFLDFCEDRDE